MNFKHLKIATLSGVCALTAFGAAPVAADEVWETRYGLIEWVDTIGDLAVLQMSRPDHPDSIRRLYIEGLGADVGGGRSGYTGYWIDDSGEKQCDVAISRGELAPSNRWGRLEIYFLENSFPSDFLAFSGNCFDAPSEQFSAFTPAN
jgi:hypothetical protein